MLQRIAIPDLNGGVSRQPDGQRFPNQVEEADNAIMHFSTGLEKRPGSELIADITDLPGDVKVHWIERSNTERYLLVFRNDATDPVSAYSIDGTPLTVSYTPVGDTASLKAYLDTSPSNIKAISIDDTTIVLNKTVVTAVETSTVSYQHASKNVDDKTSSHHKLNWGEFDLPPTVNGEYWYAQDDALGHPAGWYQGISTSSQPWYKRVRSPYAGSTLKPDTMPIRIVIKPGTPVEFEVKFCPWEPRYSGDSQTNPSPSFIGKTITDVCLHRNRLWFSAGENVIGSQTGSFYNFWLDSYATVIDSDPVDVKLSSTQVTSILWMTPFQRSIVVFTSSGQQYEIRAQDAMTPTTVSVIPSTTYSSPDVRPAVIGSQLYWTTPKGPWSQVYEYLTDEGAAQSVATDAAAHVDGYIPADIKELTASSANDILILRGTSALYINFMYWQGQKKLQSSWLKWTFDDCRVILGIQIIDDHLYMLSRVTWTPDDIFRLEKIPLRNSDALPSYRPRLDALVVATGGTFDSATKRTTFVIPFIMPDASEVFLGPDWNEKEGVRYGIANLINDWPSTTIEVVGNLSAHDVYVGCPFDMNIKMSKQHIRDQNGVQAVGAIQLKQCTVHHRNTGYFTFTVDPKTSPANNRVYKYTGKSLGAIGFITSQNIISDRDSHNFKVMGSSGNVDLFIKSDSPAPLNITGMEFVADFVPNKRSAAST